MFEYTLNNTLLNVFFVMFPLIFYPFIINERLGKSPLIQNAFLYILFTSSAILCMLIPVTKEPGILFDFRIIPFILAGFYSNRIVTLMLFITLVVFRFSMGGIGAFLTTVSSLSILVIIFAAEKKYRNLTLFHKMMVCACISFFCKMFGKINILIFEPDYHLFNAFTFYVIQAVFAALTVYILESIIKSVELKKEIIDSEKMKVVSVISASVAHEIRNPLTAVRGFIQLLTRTDIPQEKKEDYCRVCLEELDRAQEIINDYLSLAKPHPEVTERLSVGIEIGYVSKVLSSYASLHNVEIITDIDDEIYISGDRSKFRQSIINIAKNGIEAMSVEGGVLKFHVKKHKKTVILLISDNGRGMTSDQLDRLGTPYFSTKEKGTGLGTMVSFQIIKSMMGSIHVTSEIGKGTLYNIDFPIQDTLTR